MWRRGIWRRRRWVRPWRPLLRPWRRAMGCGVFLALLLGLVLLGMLSVLARCAR
ncbi:MAG: hypothetical protein ACUVX9_10260 [Anaerolineae bacterium]